jgi:hypothetical protein
MQLVPLRFASAKKLAHDIKFFGKYVEHEWEVI